MSPWKHRSPRIPTWIFRVRHFDRKISGAPSRRQLLKTPVTPNQITVFVTLLGHRRRMAVWRRPDMLPKMAKGRFLFLLTSILDGCDSMEKWRAPRQMTSAIGGWLDLWGDNVVHVAVFYGLGLGTLSA